MKNHNTGSRIYICHTYYHVYVACLKELNIHDDSRGSAVLMLSQMSTQFGDMAERAKASGIFRDAVMFDEKDYTFWPELAVLKEDQGNIVANMRQRIQFCKRLGELEEPYVPVDLAQYDDIYVFCDSDPIGYYLTYKGIRYHAVEDGLNCLRYRDTAREDNKGHFGIKAFMSRLGLIHIQNGYSRYCIDMEVNDLSELDHPTANMVEMPREGLIAGLAAEDKERLVALFIRNLAALEAALGLGTSAGLGRSSGSNDAAKAAVGTARDVEHEINVAAEAAEDAGAAGQETVCAGDDVPVQAAGEENDAAADVAAGDVSDVPVVLILTEPLCQDLETRVQLFQDMIAEYGVVDGRQARIVIKPHPRDLVDYEAVFPEHIVLDGHFPMEILNFLGARFDRVVTVYTVPSSLHCVRESVYLGNSFMDRYEDPALHAHVSNAAFRITRYDVED